MSDKLYTRDDMRRVYDEGVQAGLGDYRNEIEWLEFEDYMLKHFPEDLTDVYEVSWKVPNSNQVFTQDVAAENLTQAAVRALSLFRDKNINPNDYSVVKRV